MKEEGS
jgi:hypothetical protein